MAGLADWPWEEYWTGITFNGSRIGFNHLRIEPDTDGLYRVENRAVLAFRLLGLDKNVTLQSTDWVDANLRLVRFTRSQDMDASRQEVSGHVASGEVYFSVDSAGDSQAFSIDLDGPAYPTSVLLLLPRARGLTPGHTYEFRVFDGESRSLMDAHQEIGNLEQSEQFSGRAYRVTTRMGSNEFISWLYPDGRPALELSLGGAVVSTLETEQAALEYIATGALNKQEVLIDFSRVHVAEPIPSPRSLSRMRIRVQGIPGDFPVPRPGSGQSCSRDNDALVCEVRSPRDPGSPIDTSPPGPSALAASVAAPIHAPEISRTAAAIAGDAAPAAEKARRLLRWLQQNIVAEAVDSFSALDVLAKRRAECQGYSYLYTAFARSIGIPTRVVNGLVYSELVEGFLYHTWTESFIDGAWVTIDPIFSQYGADATHLRLLTGETPADLAPLLGLIGRISVEVLEIRYP